LISKTKLKAGVPKLLARLLLMGILLQNRPDEKA
jgi:hypothetical protein